jgi:hypothetical protein
MQFTKVRGLAAVGALLALAAPAERARRPGLPNRRALPAAAGFRTTPGWRPRKCIGGTVTIIGGTAGIIAITIVTGIAGERDSLAQRSSRPVHCGPVSI